MWGPAGDCRAFSRPASDVADGLRRVTFALMDAVIRSGHIQNPIPHETDMIRMTATGALLCTLAAQTAAADEAAKALGLNTIAAARTLSASVEGMLRHTCEVALTQTGADAVRTDIETFGTMLDLLRTGDESAWVAPVRSPRAQHALDLLEADSEMLLAFAGVGLSGSVDPAYLEHLYPAKVRSLAAASEVSDILSETFMLRRLGLLESTTFTAYSDIAAAVQSLAGDACMISVGAATDSARTNLSATLGAVADTLDRLETGDAMTKIVPPSAASTVAIACVGAELTLVAETLDGWRNGAPGVQDYEVLSARLDALDVNARQALEVFAAEVMGENGTLPACIEATDPAS